MAVKTFVSAGFFKVSLALLSSIPLSKKRVSAAEVIVKVDYLIAENSRKWTAATSFTTVCPSTSCKENIHDTITPVVDVRVYRRINVEDYNISTFLRHSGNQVCTILEISTLLSISKNHLTKKNFIRYVNTEEIWPRRTGRVRWGMPQTLATRLVRFAQKCEPVQRLSYDVPQHSTTEQNIVPAHTIKRYLTWASSLTSRYLSFSKTLRLAWNIL